MELSPMNLWLHRVSDGIVVGSIRDAFVVNGRVRMVEGRMSMPRTDKLLEPQYGGRRRKQAKALSACQGDVRNSRTPKETVHLQGI